MPHFGRAPGAGSMTQCGENPSLAALGDVGSREELGPELSGQSRGGDLTITIHGCRGPPAHGGPGLGVGLGRGGAWGPSARVALAERRGKAPGWASCVPSRPCPEAQDAASLFPVLELPHPVPVHRAAAACVGERVYHPPPRRRWG